jgi:hypothetical protein
VSAWPGPHRTGLPERPGLIVPPFWIRIEPGDISGGGQMAKLTAAECVAISVNVSLKDSISPQTLVRIFRHETDWEPWEFHLVVFFNELPNIMLIKFMKEHDLLIEDLFNIYNELPAIWQGDKFKAFYNDELAKTT